MSTIEDFLRSAGAYDSNGQIRVEKVQGSTGHWFLVAVKAADGQWADVLMLESGAPQRLEIDFGMLKSETPDGRLRAATTVRAGNGSLSRSPIRMDVM